MRDFHLLLSLRWRQFRADAIYWLRVLGYEPGEQAFLQRMYVVYLIIIGLIWAYAMWAWAVDSAGNLGTLLSQEGIAGVAATIPPLILVVQVFLLVRALRSTPLKLRFADMAYIAATPIDRAAPVLFGWLRQTLIGGFASALIAALLAIMLTRTIPEVRDAAALRAVFAAVPLLAFSVTLAWLLGLLRLTLPERIPLLWITPLLLFGVAFLVPDLVLWPGELLIAASFAELNPLAIPALIAVTGGLAAALLWTGRRIDMVRVVDESLVHARVAALGLLAWRQFDVQLRIRRQTSQASRRPWLHLPRAYGWWGLAARAALSYIRHPLMLIFALLWGAVMTQAAILIIVNGLPAQIWIGWVLVAGLAPPVGLLYVYQSDINETFLRQFLPVDGFQLLLADVALPFLALLIGAGGVWLAQGFDVGLTLSGLLFIPLIALLLAQCGGVALTTSRVLQMRLLATSLTFGALIILGLIFGLTGALVAATIAFLALGGLLVQNT